MMNPARLPVAVIGAGPVGLAAAAQLAARGLDFIVFEKGAAPGASISAWGHVQVFSPWLDSAARALLAASHWTAPDDDALPTGAEIVRDYLAPLAACPPIAAALRLSATVTAITREGRDRMSTPGRDAAPFILRWTDAAGAEQLTRARAVIDASGTWYSPSPAGVDGLPVPGERANGDLMSYGIPDIAKAERAAYAGRRVLVIGSGHSAINSILALLKLQEQEPATKIHWALRRNRIDALSGGGVNDQLPARSALGMAARRAIDDGRVQVLAPFAAERFTRDGDSLTIAASLAGAQLTLNVDRVIVATGFRPDTALTGELRVALDPAIEAPPALAPLIDPNVHSCGTVPPHGVDELTHPEAGFYIAGAKSYGRAPTFLMATGYEQVRSLADELAGNHAAAREVQLVLPETGVCSADPVSPSSCCGGPAITNVSACCAADETAKAEGAHGCGCGTPARTEAERTFA